MACSPRIMRRYPSTRIRRLQLAGKERYLDEREAGAIWNAITSLEGTGGRSSQAANCFWLLALTGVCSNLIALLRSERGFPHSSGKDR